ncbi:hypothetical protein ACOYR1_17030 [Thalassotalea piscium]
MNSKCMIASLTLLVLVGCNDTTEHLDTSQKVEKLNVDEPQNKAVESKIKQVNKSDTELLSSKINKKTIRLNGSKFSLLDGRLQKGTRVLNHGINEFGTVKGSIVVTLKNNRDIAGKHFSKVEQIAVNTLRVWPLESDKLLSFYQSLSKNSDYNHVELEIDYSPISKRQTQ